ncbi:UL16-binding protein 3-like [Mustela putorius furo]|uniref:UL16-binding protein 3-like n=1 Tax=Mustela putorius furo TaxID=9669 RepID=A0A8U0NTJ2_MUSPF|nr:UL16-binding protein 3-like [Mustela putorius furo]
MQSHPCETDVNSCEPRARPQEARPGSRPAGSFRSRRRLGVAAEPTGATKFTWCLRLLFLLLFLVREIKAAPAELVVGETPGGGEAAALSLSYNFSITSQPRPGPSWCEIQGQVNGNKFLSYACGSKEIKPVGSLGMKLKDTAFWGTQREPLKDLEEELRKKLLDIKTEIFTKSDSLTLQGRLMCERGANGHTRGSWRFAFNEQFTCLFDPENRKWTVVPPGGQWFKGTLDNDGELTKLLIGTANGDCKSWLQHVWERWDETQETTVAPTTWQDSAPTRNIRMVIVSPEVVAIVVIAIVIAIVVVIIICCHQKSTPARNFFRRTGCQGYQEAPESED